MTRPPRRGTGAPAAVPAATNRSNRLVARRRARRADGGRTITPRSLVLGATVVLLVVVLASPVARYVASRNAVNNAAQQLADDQRSLSTVRGQLAMWDNPGYVQQQARTRLQYALPGDTVYVVVRPGQQNSLQRTGGPGTDVQSPQLTWNQRLWTSVQAADHVP